MTDRSDERVTDGGAAGEVSPCGECGMLCAPGEFHPFAACLMFKGCRSANTVRANLPPVSSMADAALAQVRDREEERAWLQDLALHHKLGGFAATALEKILDRYCPEPAAEAEAVRALATRIVADLGDVTSIGGRDPIVIAQWMLANFPGLDVAAMVPQPAAEFAAWLNAGAQRPSTNPAPSSSSLVDAPAPERGERCRIVIAWGEDGMELAQYDDESFRVEQPSTKLCTGWLTQAQAEAIKTSTAAHDGLFRMKQMHLEESM